MDPGPWMGESGTLYWIFDDGIAVPMEAMDDDDWREALGQFAI